jgi:hypothetical protein
MNSSSAQWSRHCHHPARQRVGTVNFVLDGETIVFSTGEGDKLDAVRQGRVLTFEVDAVDRR